MERAELALATGIEDLKTKVPAQLSDKALHRSGFGTAL